MALHETLKNKPAHERAKLKGKEITKLRAVPKTQRSSYEIEIVEINAIPNGVEVFARAWKDGKQIGFGRKGEVELERFVIINPPLLVDDPTGDIIRVTPADPELGIERRERKLKEDPQEALLQVLEHNLSVMKNIHSDENIVRGKRGNTTTTVYPDGDPESTTVDGRITGFGEDQTWANIQGKASGLAFDDEVGGGGGGVKIQAHSNSDRWRDLQRHAYLFDTSTIGTDTIDSATLSLYGTGVKQGLTDELFINIYSSSPASDTALVNDDYDQFGTTEFSTSIGDTAWGTSGYNDFTLNASGETNINKTGVSKFGARPVADATNTEPTWTAGSAQSEFELSFADTSGTTQDPKLVVEHTASVTRRVFNIS